MTRSGASSGFSLCQRTGQLQRRLYMRGERPHHQPLVDLDPLVRRSRDRVLMRILEAAKRERLLERRRHDLRLHPLPTETRCSNDRAVDILSRSGGLCLAPPSSILRPYKGFPMMSLSHQASPCPWKPRCHLVQALKFYSRNTPITRIVSYYCHYLIFPGVDGVCYGLIPLDWLIDSRRLMTCSTILLFTSDCTAFALWLYHSTLRQPYGRVSIELYGGNGTETLST